MKSRNLIWATLMSLIVAACLISVPALSGENPWDADEGNGNGGTGSPLDSNWLDAGGLYSNALSSNSALRPSGDSEPGLFTRVSIRVSSFIISYFQTGTLKRAQSYRDAY